MISAINEAESFESAPVAAAQERMLTAGNVPASADIVLCGQTTLTPCVSIARRPLAAAPAGAAKRRYIFLFNGKSFSHAVFTVARRPAAVVLLARSRDDASASARALCTFAPHNLPTAPFTCAHGTDGNQHTWRSDPAIRYY